MAALYVFFITLRNPHNSTTQRIMTSAQTRQPGSANPFPPTDSVDELDKGGPSGRPPGQTLRNIVFSLKRHPTNRRRVCKLASPWMTRLQEHCNQALTERIPASLVSRHPWRRRVCRSHTPFTDRDDQVKKTCGPAAGQHKSSVNLLSPFPSPTQRQTPIIANGQKVEARSTIPVPHRLPQTQ